MKPLNVGEILLKMSKFWSTLPKSDDEMLQGIISLKNPGFEAEFRERDFSDTTISLVSNGPITKELLLFIFKNGLSVSGNSYLIIPQTLKNKQYNYMVDSKNSKYMGFSMTIYNTLISMGEKIRSGLTTYLTVNLQHRQKGLAAALIKCSIQKAYENGVMTGYHFIQTPRTDSNVEVYAYFRVLDVPKCIYAGYQIPTGTLSLYDSFDYYIKKAEYSDLTFTSKLNRPLNISLSEAEYESLSDCNFYKIVYEDNIVGIFGVKSVILNIAKTNSLCNIARIVYIEMETRHSFECMSKIINFLTQEKYMVMSGVCFGNLNSERLRRKLNISVSSKVYLDFFNFNLRKKYRNPESINLLYV